MKRITVLGGIGVLALTMTVGTIPATATERGAIDRGVARSLTPSLIASSLGNYGTDYDGSVYRNYKSTWTVCSLTSPDRSAGFEGMDTEIRLAFSAKNNKGVSQSIFLFPSASAAQKTFTTLQRDVKKCSGSSTETNNFGDSAGTIEWKSRVTNGSMQAVAGVPTVTVDNDWSRTSDGTTFRQDEFSTYSLVDDAIVAVTYRRSAGGSANSSEIAGVKATTKAAIEKYLGRLPVKAGSLQASYATNTASLIDKGDIPRTLGAQSTIKADQIDLMSGKRRIWLCDPKGQQFSDDSNKVSFIGITSDPATVSGEYSLGRSAGLTETILDFRSPSKASTAFSTMQKRVASCSGAFTETVSGNDDETGAPFSGTITRTYGVTEADVAGKSASIVIDSRVQVQIPATDPGTVTSQYDVLTLAGSRVVWVTYNADNDISAKQKAAVRDVAAEGVRSLG